MLLASVLSLLVMGASLAAFDGLQGNHKLTQTANDAQDVARQQTDRLARELRNLASPSQLTSDLSAQPQAVDLASAYDFVFRVVDDVRPAGEPQRRQRQAHPLLPQQREPAKEVLWRQTQTWTTAATPALPSTAACPGTGWDAGSDVQYIANVVNRYNGQNRPVFTYNSTDVLRISKVRTSLYVDHRPRRSARPRRGSPAASSCATRTASRPPASRRP